MRWNRGVLRAPVSLVLTLALALFGTIGCSGGGGGGNKGGGAAPTVTPTPGRNSVTQSNANGSTTLSIDRLEFSTGEEVTFKVQLKNDRGGPVVGETVILNSGSGLVVTDPASGVGTTGETGVFEGTVVGVFGGVFQLQATPQNLDLGLPQVTLNVAVFGTQASPTPTTGGGTTQGPGPTVTPTAAPLEDVTVLIVQALPFSISSAIGGEVQVTVFAFNENNEPVPGVRLLLDASPRVGTSFDPQTPTTNGEGQAQSVLSIQPGASVGTMIITAAAGTITGQIPIQIVSGISQRPVVTVVLESDQPVIGTQSGGTASLKARVLDADNLGIPDVNVLFRTSVGEVNPAVAVTCGSQTNPCPPSDIGLAQTTLIVPPNAIVKEYSLEALGGGVMGSATFFVVPGRGGTGTGNPNAAEGEPAAISLGASPTQIQVRETGGTELATIIVRLFDNNNNPLADRTVALRVIPDTPSGAEMLPLSGGNPNIPDVCFQDAGRQQAFDDGRLALSVTDRAGFALAAVRSGTISGTVTIEACADSLNADGVTEVAVVDRQPILTVAAGPPEVVSVAMNPLFVDNNDGTLLTTVSAQVKDHHGNTVEDGTSVFFSILNRQDVSIVGGSTTNQDPPCDTNQFTQQTGIPVTAQPGTAITCIFYPLAQAGTVVRLRAESGGVTNEDNNVQDEEFALPPGSVTGPATGKASARGFSLATEFRNISGRVSFDLTSTITAFVSDRSGNPVSRNTVVEFVTDGGSITSQNLTDLVGRTAGLLRSQGPIPPAGITTVTAFVRGEEDFIDVNQNGTYDPETDIFDPAIHDQDGDNEWSADTEIATQINVVFSGVSQISVEPSRPGEGQSDFEVGGGVATCFDVRVSDDLDNPIVGGSSISAQLTDNLEILGPAAFSVADAGATCAFAPGACNFTFCVKADDAVDAPQPAAFTVVVDSSSLPGGGNGSVSATLQGTVGP